ncbi:MAG: DUF5996 family protein [Candidatus Dormiibacterota bacterium]
MGDLKIGSQDAWPQLPYVAWKDTLKTLQMCVQIVGKVRLALTPMGPQWANVPLYVTARGLTTTPMRTAIRIFQLELDLIDRASLSACGGWSAL